MTKCCECETEIYTETDDYGWSSTKQSELCVSCRESDEESMSTVFLFNNKITKCHIGEHVRMDSYGDEIGFTEETKDIKFERIWVSTSGYRGHYETSIDGWGEVISGWTTGSWGDETSDRKAIFNEWFEQLTKEEIPLPRIPFAVVVDPTSNLFSVGVTILSPKPDELKIWMGEYIKELQDSLS